jgi:hypothetical protein
LVDLILNAITKQLGTTFGKGYHYYVEDVEQNLIKPCFTADVINPRSRSKSAVLYNRTMPVVVHYFSDSEDKKKHYYAMAEQIVECLEYLPFNNTLLRGEDIDWQIVDDVLQVFVTYRFTTKKVVEAVDTLDELSTDVTHTN